MKTQLKDNIIIQGFNDNEIVQWNELGYYLKYVVRNAPNDTRKLIYWGKTSEIPEEIAKECVTLYHERQEDETYTNYSGFEFYCLTPLESIQSACNQTYCIIYKEK